MRIYLATWLMESSQGQALTRKGAKRRLLSYYLTLERLSQFRGYILTGLNAQRMEKAGDVRVS
jgi:hypothetical protein